MAEEEKMYGEKPIVEYEEVIEFFRQRVTNKCPCCGHDKWEVSDIFESNGKKMAWGLTAIRLEDISTLSVGVSTVHAECRKCAFLRIHDLTSIAEWKKNGKPEFKGDE